MSGLALVVGAGALAQAVLQGLVDAGVQVERLSVGGPDVAPLPAAALARAGVLLLLADDDAGNVDLALQARRLQPALPLVVRVFDAALAGYLGHTLPGVQILSMSRVAAPAFAEAAQRVLATRPMSATAPAPRRERRGRRFKVDRMLAGALLSLFVLVFPSAWVFAQALNLRYMDALYFVWTTVMTVGYGDIALKDAADGIKLFGMLLMLAGAGFIAVLFALLNDWVLSRRLDMLRGRTRVRCTGHVLIAGAGNVGLRIAELLNGTERRMVFIEADPDSRNAATLAAAGHHVITADATSENILHLAAIDRAAVVLAVTDVDAVNLKIALQARTHGVPVIMRVLSPQLSAHVTERGDAIALSPVATAAQAFVMAALDHLK